MISRPARIAQTAAGPAWSRFIPEPIATASAAMFNVLAASNAKRSTPSTTLQERVKLRAASSPSPAPVASAVRSQISWTAAMSGKVSNAVQRIP